MSLIIFDCDGVLVDSEAIARREFSSALNRAGFPISEEEAGLRFTGLSLTSCAVWIEAHYGRSLPRDFFEQMQRATYQAFERELQPVAGAVEVMAELAVRGQARCVASSGSYEKINFTLSHTGLLPYLAPHLYSAQSVARGKPAPDLFLYACQQMGYAPTQALVVEDSSPGVAAAVAAGMYVIGYRQSVPVECGRRIESMSELLTAIDDWQQRSKGE